MPASCFCATPVSIQTNFAPALPPVSAPANPATQARQTNPFNQRPAFRLSSPHAASQWHLFMKWSHVKGTFKRHAQAPQILATCSGQLGFALDPRIAWVSTQDSRGLSWPGSIGEPKASQSLPALTEIRSCIGLCITLVVISDTSFDKQSLRPANPLRLGVPETRRSVSVLLQRHPMPLPCSRYSFEHALKGAAHGCVCPCRAPRVPSAR